MIKAHKFDDIKFTHRSGANTVRCEVDLSRLEGNFNRAQYLLDSAVMLSMAIYMPMVSGVFQSTTKAMSASIAGSGQVCAGAPPMGRFLYYGKVMVDEKTGSPWARRGARKVVTDRPLHYLNPTARPEWFEVAKTRHKSMWIKTAKAAAGGE